MKTEINERNHPIGWVQGSLAAKGKGLDTDERTKEIPLKIPIEDEVLITHEMEFLDISLFNFILNWEWPNVWKTTLAFGLTHSQIP